MKATNLDMIDILYAYLNGRTQISGDTYKLRRPINSNKEDIVINALPITSNQHQRGVANVNIYVPNLASDKGSQPDTKRLNTIAKEVTAILDYQYGKGYNFYIENSQIMEKENECYYNIRIKFNIFKK